MAYQEEPNSPSVPSIELALRSGYAAPWKSRIFEPSSAYYSREMVQYKFEGMKLKPRDTVMNDAVCVAQAPRLSI